MEEVVSIVKDCLNRRKRKDKVLTNDKESDKNDREVDGCTFIMIALWEGYDDSHHVERAIKTFVFGGYEEVSVKRGIGMLWDYVSIMGTDTDWNHKPISIDFYGYFAPRKSCDKEYSNNHKNMIR